MGFKAQIRGRSLVVIILQDVMPGLQRFVSGLELNAVRTALVTRLVAAFILQRCRMPASQAAGAVRSEPRHRAQVCRCLSRTFWQTRNVGGTLAGQLLRMTAPDGRRVFLLDQTLCSQQGQRTENTCSTGSRQQRPRKGRRHSQSTHARKRCHCFVRGLLISPEGIRLPFCQSYYTAEFCQQKNRVYRKQTQLAADLIRELPLAAGCDVVVLGDTAFDARVIRDACRERGFHHSRFRKFAQAETWMRLALATFLYLERHRAQQLRRRDLTPKQKRWWRCQRTFALCQAVRQLAERHELAYVAQQLNQPRGVKKMQTFFHNACTMEYRCPV